jgi:hypothetical protein
MKNFNDAIGNRTRDLPTCSTVPKPTALTRATNQKVHEPKNCANTAVCYCEWFRQLIWSAAYFLDQVCLKQCIHKQTSHPARTSTKTERCKPYTSQVTHRGISANMTRRMNLCYTEQWRFHPTVIAIVNTYSEVACSHNMLTCTELQLAIG